MGRRGAESTLRRGFLAGTGSGTAALRRPFHPVYSLLYYYAFKHRPSSRVYYSSGRASGCPIQFISGGGNNEASLYLMFWSPPILLQYISPPSGHRCSPWDFCTAKYLRPSRGRKNNEICGKHFFFRQITHTLCMGAIGFEHERVTTAESPNGPWGRNFAATPPPRVGRHRNQPIITSVGQCDSWGGGRSVQHLPSRILRGWLAHFFSILECRRKLFFENLY